MDRRQKDKSAAETALLPQYSPSQSMRARFLEAAHYPGKSMPRDYPTGDAVNELDAQEGELDCLSYFTRVENKSEMRAEFRAEITKHVGEDEAALLFLAAHHWAFDPFSQIARRLQKSVAEYAAACQYPDAVIESRLTEFHLKEVVPLCSSQTIHCALALTHQMLTYHMEQWIESRTDSDEMSESSVILHRGIHRRMPYTKSDTYEERGFLAAYSLSPAVAEKFALEKSSDEAAMIISADLPFFAAGILLFSPFVDGMIEGQVEAVVLLGSRPDLIRYDGEHGGGIHEHYLAPAQLHTATPLSSSAPRKYGFRPAIYDCELHDQTPTNKDGESLYPLDGAD
jgi:hypothetical protein